MASLTGASEQLRREGAAQRRAPLPVGGSGDRLSRPLLSSRVAAPGRHSRSAAVKRPRAPSCAANPAARTAPRARAPPRLPSGGLGFNGGVGGGKAAPLWAPGRGPRRPRSLPLARAPGRRRAPAFLSSRPPRPPRGGARRGAPAAAA